MWINLRVEKMDSYKGLNIKRDAIDEIVNTFIETNSLTLRENTTTEDKKKKRICLGKPGVKDAMVDLHLNNDGTTTIQYKIGKNQQLGEELAKYLFSTINPDELISVNFSLNGISADDITPILDEVRNSTDELGATEFDITLSEGIAHQKVSRIISKQHQDVLVVTHYPTTNNLTLQGRPLFCYRKVIYLISELLDLNGLQTVLSRTEENTVAIVRDEVARDYIKNCLEDSYNELPAAIERLLVSGCCIKLASPSLPEYSMLLFPDLRALEGVLRTILGLYDMYPETEDKGFGTFLIVRDGVASFRQEFGDKVTHGSKMIQAIESGYSFYVKHRHSLFHMSDFANASREIDTLDKSLSLSRQTYDIINNLYRAKTAHK